MVEKIIIEGDSGVMGDKKKINMDEYIVEKSEERIVMMESSDYVFSKRFSRKDYILVGVVAIISLLIIIAGAFIS